MTVKIVATLYIFGGLSQLILWPILIIKGQVPELDTELTFMLFHLCAEFLGAVLALASGIGLWLNRNWAKKLYFFTTGLVVTAGYLAAMFYMFTAAANGYIMIAILSISTLLQVLLLFILFAALLPGVVNRRAKLILLMNGALVYALINGAGLSAQTMTAYAPGLVSVLMALIVAGIISARSSWNTIEKGVSP